LFTILNIFDVTQVAAENMFAGHANHIVIVQELIGTGVWWPQMGVYTLQTLEPGKAYKIKVLEAFILDFPECE